MHAYLVFFGRAKLLRHVGIGVVHASDDVEFLGVGSLQPNSSASKEEGNANWGMQMKEEARWEGTYEAKRNKRVAKIREQPNTIKCKF